MKHQIAIITPAPDLVEAVVQHSMLRQAVEREKVDFHLVNLREFGEGNYRQTDDTPFGGGAGMVMMAGSLRSPPTAWAEPSTRIRLGKLHGPATCLFLRPSDSVQE